MHGGNRLGDFRRRFRRAVDFRRMIDQAGDDAGLIADLMQVAHAAADLGIGDLPDQRQHRRVHAIGGQQRRARVEQAGPRHHRIGLRLAGRQRRAQRHIGRALLVAGMDHTEPVAGPLKGVEQVVVMDAGQGVDGINSVRQQGRHGGLGRGHVREDGLRPFVYGADLGLFGGLLFGHATLRQRALSLQITPSLSSN